MRDIRAIEVCWRHLALALTCLILVGCPDDKKVTNPVASTDSTDTTNTTDGTDGTNTTDGTDGTDSTDNTGTDAEGILCKNDGDCATAFGDISACQKATCDLVSSTCKLQSLADGTQCDDGDSCTTADQCKNASCAGGTMQCNDDNPCTADSCDAGACVFAPTSAGCDDGNLCTQNDACKDGVCTGDANPDCECQTDADCAQFDDADLCNGVLGCVDSQCLPKDGSIVTCDASLAGPCQEVACDPADGQCKAGPLAEGSACDDENACTKSDACAGGVCKGAPVVCDDGNGCTADSCDTESGCLFTNTTEGCDDGDLCTLDDACLEGECTGATNPECDCTDDADCAEFEDGDLCNGTLECTGGKCVVEPGTVVDCSEDAAAAPACKVVLCNATSGACETKDALDGASCDDANPCTYEDHCLEAACKGLPLLCNDDNACTDDSCDLGEGCVFAPNAASCDDGNACTTGDTCADGACAGTDDPACQCLADADCAGLEDGDQCNGTLQCVDNQCIVNPATVVVCDDEGLDSCVVTGCTPETGKCTKTVLADGGECDDENACTASDFCSGGVCKGKPVFCDDGALCTDDTCDPDVGCVHAHNDAPCDDGNSCTQNDKCALGVCGGNPVADCVCSADTDCAPFEDGNPCNGTLACFGQKCVVDPATVVVCPPAEDPECSLNQCVATTGECQALPYTDGKLCDDGDACTATDSCASGVCVGTGAVECDDENPCTDDSCAPEFGCVAAPNEAPCDDGDDCTEGDTCGLGICQPGDTNICPETCSPAWALSCGGQDSWGTTKGGATNVVGGYSCNGWSYTGPEYTYTFTAPYDGSFTATLSSETAVTDVLVLEQSDLGCDPKACLTYGFAAATTEMVAGKTYYIVVDGFNGAEGDYTIEMGCVPSHELSCTDGEDEDQDGATDCGDPDCAEDPACAPPECEPAWTLGCGGTDAWANYNPGSTNVIESYTTCGNPWSYPAPEYTYNFTSPVTGEVTVTLSNETAETDVIVLQSADGTCNGEQCVAFGLGGVTFDAVEGTTYYLVVDGFNGAQGTYTIGIECPAETETVCDDGIDDDGDDAIDCADEDCQGLPHCAADCNPLTETVLACGESKVWSNTDPLNAKSMQADYSCSTDAFTGPEVSAAFVAPYDGAITITLSEESAETDILVITDAGGVCDAANCLVTGFSSVTFDAKAGSTYWVVIDGYNGAEGTFTIDVGCTPFAELDCTDGNDEDGDGAADCEDSDCFGSSDACQPACVPDTAGPATLTCPSDTDSWSNNGGGSTNVINKYACVPYTYNGNEYVYTYVADTTGPVTVELSNETVETDVIVLHDNGLGCNPASCVTYGLSKATFDAEEGKTYYIVVDGFQTANGSYDLAFTCGE